MTVKHEDDRVIREQAFPPSEVLPSRRYRLLCEQRTEGEGIRCSYSILCEAGEEAVYLPDITSEKDRAVAIYELLLRGEVTPTTIYEVMDEVLAR